MSETEIIYDIFKSHIQQSKYCIFINEVRLVPNVVGCIKKGNDWYSYESDEKNNTMIQGPFSLNGIIRALALRIDLKIAEEYKFSQEDEQIFYTKFYYSFSEIDPNFLRVANIRKENK